MFLPSLRPAGCKVQLQLCHASRAIAGWRLEQVRLQNHSSVMAAERHTPEKEAAVRLVVAEAMRQVEAQWIAEGMRLVSGESYWNAVKRVLATRVPAQQAVAHGRQVALGNGPMPAADA